jgi:hypothetical protein
LTGGGGGNSVAAGSEFGPTDAAFSGASGAGGAVSSAAGVGVTDSGAREPARCRGRLVGFRFRSLRCLGFRGISGALRSIGHRGCALRGCSGCFGCRCRLGDGFRCLGGGLVLTGGLGRIGGGRLGDVLDQGELELERDLVADEHATGIELRIPGHAPVLAVDAARALEAGAQVAERVGLDADELERDRHGLRHVTDRQITGDDIGAFVHLVDG